MMTAMKTRIVAAALIAGLWLAAGPLAAQAPRNPDPWPSLAFDIFGDRPLEVSQGVIELEAPYRAEDAAMVPVTIRTALPEGDRRHVSKVTLVIDENPAPVAAEFHFGPQARVSELSTRVRVDTYTKMHAVAELSDGSLHVTERFVKASGGCSAPAGKNPDEALANLGQMKFRQFPTRAEAPDRREVQLMVRHPNSSGLQMDQLTRNYIPLHIVRELSVTQGGELVLRMEGGISLSEDPNFRFSFSSNGAGGIEVEATDTNEAVFRGQWRLDARPSES